MNKLKALGLAIVAMLAIGAISASAASAANFTSESYPVSLFGEQPEGAPHVFSAGGGSVGCTEATFAGENTGPSETQTITPTYAGCTAFGFSAQVTMNGCDYLFHVGGTVDLKCSGSNEVTIDTVGNICTVHIPPQNGINNITYTNKGNHVDVNANANNIKATITKNSFLCPLSNQTVENATYKGDVTLKGNGGTTKIDVG